VRHSGRKARVRGCCVRVRQRPKTRTTSNRSEIIRDRNSDRSRARNTTDSSGKRTPYASLTLANRAPLTTGDGKGASGASSASLLSIVVATVTASQSTSVAPQAHQGGSRGVYLRTCHQVSVTVRTVRTASVARSQAQWSNPRIRCGGRSYGRSTTECPGSAKEKAYALSESDMRRAHSSRAPEQDLRGSVPRRSGPHDLPEQAQMPSQSRIQDMRGAAYCCPAGDAGHENRKLKYLSPSRHVICMLY